jgi:hypothetical protein
MELAGVADAEQARRTRDAAYRAEAKRGWGPALERSLAGARTESADGERDRRAEDVAPRLALAQRWEAETSGGL